MRGLTNPPDHWSLLPAVEPSYLFGTNFEVEFLNMDKLANSHGNAVQYRAVDMGELKQKLCFLYIFYLLTNYENRLPHYTLHACP
jgi:hypothetical protein